MNYGISPGGGYSVSVPVSGYGTSQGYSSYQPQGWNSNQGGSWSQTPMGYSQPVYGQQTAGWQTSQGWGYSQPVNQGWTTMQPSGWSGQTYSQPPPTYYSPPPQQYGFHSMPFMSGCGNCGHTKPMIRRDW